MKSKKYLLGKALLSSGSGWPLAFLANIAILPLFITMLQDNLLLASILIGVVFGIISMARIFVIDYVEDRYGLNIRPDHVIRKLIARLK